jgi:hypothetical protein
MVVTKQNLADQWVALNSGRAIGRTFITEFSALQSLYYFQKLQFPSVRNLTEQFRYIPESMTGLSISRNQSCENIGPSTYRINRGRIKGIFRLIKHNINVISSVGNAFDE